MIGVENSDSISAQNFFFFVASYFVRNEENWKKIISFILDIAYLRFTSIFLPNGFTELKLIKKEVMVYRI